MNNHAEFGFGRSPEAHESFASLCQILENKFIEARFRQDRINAMDVDEAHLTAKRLSKASEIKTLSLEHGWGVDELVDLVRLAPPQVISVHDSRIQTDRPEGITNSVVINVMRPSLQDSISEFIDIDSIVYEAEYDPAEFYILYVEDTQNGDRCFWLSESDIVEVSPEGIDGTDVDAEFFENLYVEAATSPHEQNVASSKKVLLIDELIGLIKEDLHITPFILSN